MSTLTPFHYGQHDVRAFLVDGDPWFVAADVARVLGYRDAEKLTRRLDPEDRGTRSVGTPGGEQQMTVISEPGLYVAVLGSQVDGARMFKRWITHEVLPTLRRTGTYTTAETQLALPQTYAEALRALADEHEAKELAQARAAELEPAAAAWDTLASARGDYSVADAAKVLSRDEHVEIGRDRLFALMAELRWVYRTGARNRWHAYQSQVSLGRLVMRAGASFQNARTGEMEAADPTVRVTAKGLQALHQHLTRQVVPA